VTLSARAFAKRLRSECLHCGETALDGSDYCAPHDAKERGQRSTRQRRLRQKRADAGLCMSGCGRKVSRRRRPDGTVLPRECPTCSDLHRKRVAKARERVRNEHQECVTGDEQIPPRGHWKLAHGSADAEARGWRPVARYVGRDRRGAPSREDRRRDALRSRDDGLALAVRFERARITYEGDDVQAMPRIQRDAALEEVRDLLRRASRMFEDAAELYG
jgi:hypothetical protein